MPVEITLPLGAQVFGPGAPVTFRSTTVDPGPGPYDWEIELLYGPTFETQLYLIDYGLTTAPEGLHRIGTNRDFTTSNLQVSRSVTHGTQVKLFARMTNDLGQREEGQVTFPWDTNAWLHWDLWNQLRTLPQTVGGYTDEDRQQAQITQMGVSLPLPGVSVGQEIASGITGFFTSPPQWAMNNFEFVDLEGNGDLTRPGAGRQVNAYGCQLSFLEIPPDLGVDFTVPARYHETIAQLAVVRSGLSQLEYYDQIVPFNVGDQRLMWGTPFPVRISYAIFPRCKVRLWWLHLAPGWWPF